METAKNVYAAFVPVLCNVSVTEKKQVMLTAFMKLSLCFFEGDTTHPQKICHTQKGGFRSECEITILIQRTVPVRQSTGARCSMCL